jgi:hypothetical protein
MAGSVSSNYSAQGEVWETISVFTFASGDTAEVKENLPVIRKSMGILQKIIVKCSGASGASVTATVAIDDNSDNEIFSVDSLAESTTFKYNVSEPIAGVMDIGVTPSTDPLSAYTVTVYLRGI